MSETAGKILAATALESTPDLKPKVVDLDGAAKYMATTPRHVQRLYWERRLPFIKVGKKVAFLISDLDSFLESNRTPAVRQ